MSRATILNSRTSHCHNHSSRTATIIQPTSRLPTNTLPTNTLPTKMPPTRASQLRTQPTQLLVQVCSQSLSWTNGYLILYRSRIHQCIPHQNLVSSPAPGHHRVLSSHRTATPLSCVWPSTVLQRRKPRCARFSPTSSRTSPIIAQTRSGTVRSAMT